MTITRNPDFRKLWAAQSVSVLGSAITTLALPTAAILQLHASAFEVGVLAALQRLPFLFLSLPAGAWLDRVNRRPVMIACDLGRGHVLASIPLAGGLGMLGLGQLYAAGFLVGCFTVFFDVAYLAFLPALVSRDDLLAGNQRLQMTGSIANLAGPGLAGRQPPPRFGMRSPKAGVGFSAARFCAVWPAGSARRRRSLPAVASASWPPPRSRSARSVASASVRRLSSNLRPADRSGPSRLPGREPPRSSSRGGRRHRAPGRRGRATGPVRPP